MPGFVPDEPESSVLSRTGWCRFCVARAGPDGLAVAYEIAIGSQACSETSKMTAVATPVERDRACLHHHWQYGHEEHRRYRACGLSESARWPVQEQ